MNLPTATTGLAAGALEPAFGSSVDIAREEIPAFAAVLCRVGLGDRGHRAARAGFRILPVLAGILVALGEHVGGGVAGKGEIAVSRRRVFPADRAGEIALVHLGHWSVHGTVGGAVVSARHAAAARTEADQNHGHHN